MKLDSLNHSRKNPLSSGNDLASTSITSDKFNRLNVNGIITSKNQNPIQDYLLLVNGVELRQIFVDTRHL